MKYFRLVWSALVRRRARTVFTAASVWVAFLLFGMLDSVRTAFVDVARTAQGAHTLITLSAFGGAGGAGQLPLSLRSQIAAVPGVRAVSQVSPFNGFYQNPSQHVAGEAVGRAFFRQQGVVFSPGELKAFSTTRDGAVVDAALARQWGWHVGERIPLRVTAWPHRDGSDVWTFDLVGIFRTKDPDQALQTTQDMLFVRWDYFDAARAFDRGEVGWYEVQIADPKLADRVGQVIDALSANSDHATRTQSLNEFVAAMLNQAVDIGLIVRAIMAAVFFTLILLTGNTLAQGVRERVPELAVLKTIGFGNCRVLALVLAESVSLVVVGGVAGMLGAAVVIGVLRRALGAGLPLATLAGTTWGAGLGLMLVIGLVVGALPALRGMHLHVVDALAER